MTENPLVWAYAAGILLGFILGWCAFRQSYQVWPLRSETKKPSKIEDTLLGHPIYWTEDLGEDEILLRGFRDYELFKVQEEKEDV